MSTTTIRLDDELKARVAAAAERAGKTAHGYMLDAIAQSVEQAELAHHFSHEAGQRWSGILATGKTVAWDSLQPYLVARAAGKAARKPRARKLGR